MKWILKSYYCISTVSWYCRLLRSHEKLIQRIVCVVYSYKTCLTMVTTADFVGSPKFVDMSEWGIVDMNVTSVMYGPGIWHSA